MKNAVVVTQDDDRRVLHHTAILIKGDRIAAVGPTREIEHANPQVPVYDCTGKAVIPGFINSHTHTILTVLRGTVEDWDGNAVYGYMSPVSYTMSAEERTVMAVLGVLEGIRCGTTMFVDPFRHVTSYAEGMARTGARLLLSENCADVNTLKIRRGDYSEDREFGQTFLDRTVEGIERFHNKHGGRLQIQIAAHATDNCSPWMLDQLTALARKHNMPRTVHLAQSIEEVRQVRARWNCTPAEFLDHHGWAAPDVIGAHWTYCTEGDIDILAEKGVHFVHCPANSSRRGPHPVRAGYIRDRGVNVCFGSDNMTEDLFHTMKIGLIVHRGSYGLGIRPQPEAIFDGMNRNGAIAIGRLDDLGTIEAGKKADLAIVNLRNPSLTPVINLVGNLVHYGHPGVVESTICDGEWLMRGGKVLTIDEQALVKEAQLVTRRVWERMLAQNPDIPPPRPWQWIET
ncbi:MAG: amidohydrolase family protein [Alphaproteobacteria bacterium]|nr:amidohydrolase family protein [Alphaproteobacteria bacterium]